MERQILAFKKERIDEECPTEALIAWSLGDSLAPGQSREYNMGRADGVKTPEFKQAGD